MQTETPLSDRMLDPSQIVSYLWTFSHGDCDLEETLAGYLDVLAAIPGSKELVVVDDGVGPPIQDGIVARLRSAPFPAACYFLHRGAGEAAALTTGLRHSVGQAIVLLPSYRQVDDAEISRFTDAIRNGPLDYIASWRHPRVDGWPVRTLSRFFNALTSRLTGVQLHDITSGLRAMRRGVVEEISIQGDLHRFLPVLVAMHGFRVGEIQVRHVEERVRAGDYRLGIFVRRFLDLLSLFFLTKFTRKPLRFFGLVGTAVASVGAVILFTLAVQRLFGVPIADRPLLVLGVLMFILGAQLFSIGLLGELIIFTYGRDLREYKVDTVYEGTTPEP